jgi:sec-independent protein translocase protein TatA
MFRSLGTPELLLIFGALILVFGGSKIASLGKDLGRAISGFRKEVKETKDVSEKLSDISETVKKPL